MRLTLVCATAAKLPTSMLNTAEIHSAQNQNEPAALVVARIRRSRANAAALGPEDISAVTGVGAPSYTSGVQTWKGAAATLKPRPTSISAKPSRRKVGAPGRFDRTASERRVVPVAP